MKLLLTGAAGGVATMIRPLLLERYGSVLLSDLVQSESLQPENLQPGETFVQADLGDVDQIDALTKQCDAIIHLGGISIEQPWDPILAANIAGLYTLYESARVNGVERIVFASSNHAVGFYPRDIVIDHQKPVRPDSRYGVSKAFGEALGALYADKHGLKIFNIRIGNVGYKPIDRRRMSIWFHPEDLVQLCAIGLEHPEIHYEIVYGFSECEPSWWDNRRAKELGYRPKHRSADFRDEVLAADPPPGPGDASEIYQGGTFVLEP